MQYNQQQGYPDQSQQYYGDYAYNQNYQYQQQPQNYNIPQGQPINQQGYQQQPNYYQQHQNQDPQYSQMMGQQVVVVGVSRSQTADRMPFPANIQCPYCQKQIITRIENRIGDQTLLASCLILLFCWPLFWIPCVLSDCKDKVHICPQCGHQVGIKRYEMC